MMSINGCHGSVITVVQVHWFKELKYHFLDTFCTADYISSGISTKLDVMNKHRLVMMHVV